MTVVIKAVITAVIDPRLSATRPLERGNSFAAALGIGQDHGHDSGRTAMIPVELAGDGLLLRAWRSEDADAVFRACQDPLIQRWTTVPVPYLPEHADGLVELGRKGWATETAALFGVFDAGTGELLGSHGLIRLDLDRGVAETGLWIAPWARGRGVGTRATRAVAHWALDVLGLHRLTWLAEVGNHASRLVAERVGFAFDGVQRALFHDRKGGVVDGWRGVLQPGRIRREPPAWLARGAPGARRAATFGRPQPVLAAGPVTLRPAADRDIDDMVAVSHDSESIRWTNIPVPYGAPDARWFLDERCRGRWAAGTSATFVIADPDDRFAGTVDLRIDPTDPVIAEIGFLVAPWARRRGYATAAVRATCAWGFDALALTRIVWRAHVGNVGSQRVAELAGFVAEGVQRASCEQRGERRDGWVAGLLAGDLSR
jgi:RimJ/RimL family protein N-acetyltransferase